MTCVFILHFYLKCRLKYQNITHNKMGSTAWGVKSSNNVAFSCVTSTCGGWFVSSQYTLEKHGQLFQSSHFCLLLQRMLPSLISDTPNCENKFTKLTKKSRLKGQDFTFYQHFRNEDPTCDGMSNSVKKIHNFCLQLQNK